MSDVATATVEPTTEAPKRRGRPPGIKNGEGKSSKPKVEGQTPRTNGRTATVDLDAMERAATFGLEQPEVVNAVKGLRDLVRESGLDVEPAVFQRLLVTLATSRRLADTRTN
jgi:hypothetical protein